MPDQQAGTLSVHKGTLTQAMDTYIVTIQGNGGIARSHIKQLMRI